MPQVEAALEKVAGHDGSQITQPETGLATVENLSSNAQLARIDDQTLDETIRNFFPPAGSMAHVNREVRELWRE